ncbi:unnamed protein product [Chilo suppressalis]|uniref:Uncharacterized protein n=1 Tax=Chilo suppressalis TaxID=168631 RepID=A0ABN8B3M6_CHISP|nr:hypothetical protein evm_013028 [Chilo suppressalis]CAH0402020.1 unnamed protein product [Chilo suppressalis]
MDSTVKPSSRLVLTSILSGSLTLIFSIVYITLSIIALIFRFNCNAISLDSLTTSDFFIIQLYRIYILNEECLLSESLEGVTSDYSVFVLTTITLVASLVTLVAAVVLLAAITSASETSYLNIFIYGYIGVCVCSLIVDITFGAHFGVDLTYLTNQVDTVLSEDPFQIYSLQMLRLGAWLFMSICLKFYIGHLVNIVLLIFLVVYVIEYAKELNVSKHSIHKLGVVKAYESPIRNDVCNHHCDICSQRNRNGRAGSQINYGYSNDEEPPRSRSPVRNNMRPEYNNSVPVLDRSSSWQPAAGSSRPFTYLEDVRQRPPPLTMPPSPSPSDAQWRRDRWQSGMPPLPAPDYSPQGPRRLKSALKS